MSLDELEECELMITALGEVARLFIDNGPVRKANFDMSSSVSQWPDVVELKPWIILLERIATTGCLPCVGIEAALRAIIQ